MNSSETSRGLAKDLPVYALALGIPVLATTLGAWMFLVDILAIAPLVWLGVRKGTAQVALVTLLAAVGVYFLSYSIALAVGKGLLLLGVSLLLTIGFRANWRSGKILFWGSVAGMGYGIADFLQLGPHPITQLETALTGSLGDVMQSYRQAGILQLMQNQGISESQVKDSLLQGLKLIARLYPSLEILNVILIVVISFLFTRYILRKESVVKGSIAPFREWSLPWYAIWGAIFGIAAYLGGDYLNIYWLSTVGINIAVSYLPICIVLGAAITTYIFTSPKFPSLFKFFLIVFAFFNLPVTALILALLGLFDMVLNFRRIPESVS